MIKKQLPIIAEYSACAALGLTNAMLNALAMISGDSKKLFSINNLEELGNLLNGASTSQLTLGAITFFASISTSCLLNKGYLLDSVKASLKLFQQLAFCFVRCCRPKHTITWSNKKLLLELALFTWAALTSLPFAYIGSLSFSAFGQAGMTTGLIINFASFMITRYFAARVFFNHLANPQWRKKQHYRHQLEILDQQKIHLTERVDRPVDNQSLAPLNKAIEQFLLRTARYPEAKSKCRTLCFRPVSAITGSLLALVLFLPQIIFLSQAVEGAEKITGLSIGKGAHYQNTASWLLGLCSILLTSIFYSMSIGSWPKHFIQAGFSIYNKIVNNKKPSAVKYAGFVITSALFCYLSTGGFTFLAEQTIEKSYLSFLGNNLSRLIPTGLYFTGLFMVWSNVLASINSIFSPTLPKKLLDINEINIHNAPILLTKEEINIFSQQSHRACPDNPGLIEQRTPLLSPRYSP